MFGNRCCPTDARAERRTDSPTGTFTSHIVACEPGLRRFVGPGLRISTKRERTSGRGRRRVANVGNWSRIPPTGSASRVGSQGLLHRPAPRPASRRGSRARPASRRPPPRAAAPPSPSSPSCWSPWSGWSRSRWTSGSSRPSGPPSSGRPTRPPWPRSPSWPRPRPGGRPERRPGRGPGVRRPQRGPRPSWTRTSCSAGTTRGSTVGSVFTTSYGALTPNAVRVTLRRDRHANGPLNLFFAPVIGRETADVRATALATMELARGILPGGRTPAVRRPPGLLPLRHRAGPAGGGRERHHRLVRHPPGPGPAAGGRRGQGTDPVHQHPEAARATSGRWTSGATPTTPRTWSARSSPGPSAADFAHPDFAAKVTDGALYAPNTFTGDPGISGGVENAFQSIVGQRRIIPLYSEVVMNGNNATYTISGFAGVTIVAVDLKGNPKRIVAQPTAFFTNKVTASPGGGTAPDQRRLHPAPPGHRPLTDPACPRSSVSPPPGRLGRTRPQPEPPHPVSTRGRHARPPPPPAPAAGPPSSSSPSSPRSCSPSSSASWRSAGWSWSPSWRPTAPGRPPGTPPRRTPPRTPSGRTPSRTWPPPASRPRPSTASPSSSSRAAGGRG